MSLISVPGGIAQLQTRRCRHRAGDLLLDNHNLSQEPIVHCIQEERDPLRFVDAEVGAAQQLMQWV